MRSDDALLLDMLIAARKIRRYVAGMTQEAFYANEMAQSAVIREIQVIGEAARLLTAETKARHSGIAWASMTGIRNRIIHEYFNIDLGIVWSSIHEDIPVVMAQLEKIVPPEDEGEAH